MATSKPKNDAKAFPSQNRFSTLENVQEEEALNSRKLTLPPPPAKEENPNKKELTERSIEKKDPQQSQPFEDIIEKTVQAHTHQEQAKISAQDPWTTHTHETL